MEPIRLNGVRAPVTGGSSGLGLAMSEALLCPGASVTLAARPGSRLEMRCNALLMRDTMRTNFRLMYDPGIP